MVVEPYETEPADIPVREEIEALFANAERLRREIADELSIVTRKERARIARYANGEDD